MLENPFSLKDKHILITGASSGIGRQCAISCSQMGARVTLVARNQERLTATLEEMSGDNHYVVCCDISELDKIKGVVATAVLELGRIDGFVHSAGIGTTLPLKMHTYDILNKQTTINVYAAFEFVRQISLKKNKALTQSIVMISSIAGVVGKQGLVGYSASKGALIAGVKSLSMELYNRSIRVNAISPGHLADSAMSWEKGNDIGDAGISEIEAAHPLGLGQCVDVANAAVYLLSRASKWVTGTNLIVDGGYCAK